MAAKLSVELVPSTAWWSNVRSNVSRADWEKCKRYVRNRSKDRCEICGGRGRKWPVECHEIWDYDDERQIQTLIDLIALCPKCHQVKHFGRTSTVGGEKTQREAFEHLRKVNTWSIDRTAKYLDLAFQIWEIRSEMNWRLDISFLGLLGIEAKVSDRA